MPRASWGSVQDLSGLFGSLVGQYENRIESETQRALRRAQADQDSRDSEMQSKWKNGEISDEQWLAYLQQRVDDSRGDPEEYAKWSDILREHTGAIEDAQIETEFRLGKVTIGALMAHYRKRMSGVEKNSPAYRDLASRYAELSDAADQVGGGYRYGRGGGGKSKSVVKGGKLPKTPTMTASGFDLTGPDVITPDTKLTGIEDDDDYINDLEADKNRFKSIYTFIKNNPDATQFVDARTGDVFPLDKETLLALDKQNIRNNNLRAAYWAAKGDDKKMTAALDDNTYFMATTLPEHNTLMGADERREWQQHVVDRLAAASADPDPSSRMQAYQTLAKAAAKRNQNIYTNTVTVARTHITEGADADNLTKRSVQEDVAKPVEVLPDEQTRTNDFNLQRALEVISDPTMSPEQVSSELNSILEQTPSIGEGGSAISLESLLEGPRSDGGTNDLPPDYVGPLQTRTQLMGLINADNPEYSGPRYVYAMENGQPRVVEAELQVQHQQGGAAVPVVTPKGADENTAVMTRQKIDGQNLTVWASIEPIDDPQYDVYRLQKAQVIDGKRFEAGQLVPSSVISRVGMASLRTMERNGVVARESTVEGVVLADGSTWFRDPEGGLFYPGKLPATTHEDGVTGGLYVSDSGDVDTPAFSSFAQGFMVPYAGISRKEMQGWIMQEAQMGRINPLDYRGRDAGGQLSDAPIDVASQYYSPQKQAHDDFMSFRASEVRDRTAADRLAEDAERERREKAQQWVRTNLSSTEQAKWRHMQVDPEEWAVERLRQFGSDIGLNLGPAFDDVDAPNAQQRKQAVIDRLSARTDALQARQSRDDRDRLRAEQPRLVARPSIVEREDIVRPATAPIKPVVLNDTKISAPAVDRSYVPKRTNFVEGADIVPKAAPSTIPTAPSGKSAPGALDGVKVRRAKGRGFTEA